MGRLQTRRINIGGTLGDVAPPRACFPRCFGRWRLHEDDEPAERGQARDRDVRDGRFQHRKPDEHHGRPRMGSGVGLVQLYKFRASTPVDTGFRMTKEGFRGDCRDDGGSRGFTGFAKTPLLNSLGHSCVRSPIATLALTC